MGVEGLWKLVSPCGRRLTLDTLTNRKLAIDVSIWLVQFIKAMRNEEGQMLKNAHVNGMLRRILRLLYYGIHPVFVFDGPAPTLKRLTIAQRMRARSTHNESIKRAAERLLLTQLKMKSMRGLRRKLAEEEEKQQLEVLDGELQRQDSSNSVSSNTDATAAGEPTVQQLVNKAKQNYISKNQSQPKSSSATNRDIVEINSDDDDDDEAPQLIGPDDEISAADRLAIYQAMMDNDEQPDTTMKLEPQVRVTRRKPNRGGGLLDDVPNHEMSLDEQIAFAVANADSDHEEQKQATDSSNAASDRDDDQDGVLNELYVTNPREMPDRETLQALPPHIRERVIEQTKERLGMSNRRKLIRIDRSGDYQHFSSSQLHSFVKRAKFNAQVNAMHSEGSAAATNGAGLHTHKIASEPDRHYVLYDRSTATDEAMKPYLENDQDYVEDADNSDMEEQYAAAEESKAEEPTKEQQQVEAVEIPAQPVVPLWECEACTCTNDMSLDACIMCGTPRPAQAQQPSPPVPAAKPVEDSVDTSGGFERPAAAPAKQSMPRPTFSSVVYDDQPAVLSSSKFARTAADTVTVDDDNDDDIEFTGGGFVDENDVQIEEERKQPAPLPSHQHTIHTSKPFMKRDSKFCGHAAACTSKDELTALRKQLAHKQLVQDASCNILAARYTDTTTGKVVEVLDDDGESRGAQNIMQIIKLFQLTDVMCVVSRHFGGTHLGYARFDYIKDAAREVLQMYKTAESGGGGKDKPLQVDESKAAEQSTKPATKEKGAWQPSPLSFLPTILPTNKPALVKQTLPAWICTACMHKNPPNTDQCHECRISYSDAFAFERSDTQDDPITLDDNSIDSTSIYNADNSLLSSDLSRHNSTSAAKKSRYIDATSSSSDTDSAGGSDGEVVVMNPQKQQLLKGFSQWQNTKFNRTIVSEQRQRRKMRNASRKLMENETSSSSSNAATSSRSKRSSSTAGSSDARVKTAEPSVDPPSSTTSSAALPADERQHVEEEYTADAILNGNSQAVGAASDAGVDTEALRILAGDHVQQTESLRHAGDQHAEAPADSRDGRIDSIKQRNARPSTQSMQEPQQPAPAQPTIDSVSFLSMELPDDVDIDLAVDDDDVDLDTSFLEAETADTTAAETAVKQETAAHSSPAATTQVDDDEDEVSWEDEDDAVAAPSVAHAAVKREPVTSADHVTISDDDEVAVVEPAKSQPAATEDDDHFMSRDNSAADSALPPPLESVDLVSEGEESAGQSAEAEPRSAQADTDHAAVETHHPTTESSEAAPSAQPALSPAESPQAPPQLDAQSSPVTDADTSPTVLSAVPPTHTALKLQPRPSPNSDMSAPPPVSNRQPTDTTTGRVRFTLPSLDDSDQVRSPAKPRSTFQPGRLAQLTLDGQPVRQTSGNSANDEDEPRLTSTQKRAAERRLASQRTADERASSSAQLQVAPLPDASEFNPNQTFTPYRSIAADDNGNGAALAQEIYESHVVDSQLRQQAARHEQGAAVVTADMIADCKDLLRAFGIPYIEAPGEAEAQCVELERLGLVDGVVTDDSDTLVFGGQSIYKHVFEEKKYAEYYKAERVYKEYGLDKRKFIHIALLLGSDYTLGVRGVGMVNAMEIVNAFPTDDGLIEWRQWCYSGSVEKKPSVPSNYEQLSAEEQAAVLAAYRKQKYKYDHRNVRSTWDVGIDFPSQAVINAYLHPNVDHDTTPFRWGSLDTQRIALLCHDKLEWSDEYIAAQINPVIDNMHRLRQQQIGRYFEPETERFAMIKSQRLRKAVQGLTNSQLQQLVEQQAKKQAASKRSSARKAKKQGAADAAVDDELQIIGELDDATLTEVAKAIEAENEQQADSGSTSTTPQQSPVPRPARSKTKKVPTASLDDDAVVADDQNTESDFEPEQSTPKKRKRAPANPKAKAKDSTAKPKAKRASKKKPAPSDSPEPTDGLAADEVMVTSSKSGIVRVEKEQPFSLEAFKINRKPVLTLWATCVALRCCTPHITSFDQAAGVARVLADRFAASKGKTQMEIQNLQVDYGKVIAQRGSQTTIPLRLMNTTVCIDDSSKNAINLEGKVLTRQSSKAYLKRAFDARLEDARIVMTELAEAYPPEDLAKRAYGLYEVFRPKIGFGATDWRDFGELDLLLVRELTEKANREYNPSVAADTSAELDDAAMLQALEQEEQRSAKKSNNRDNSTVKQETAMNVDDTTTT